MKSISWSQKQLERHDRPEDYLCEDDDIFNREEDHGDLLNGENMLNSFDADNSCNDNGSETMTRSSSADLPPSNPSVPAEKPSAKFKPLKIRVSGSKQKVTIFKTPECEYICQQSCISFISVISQITDNKSYSISSELFKPEGLGGSIGRCQQQAGHNHDKSAAYSKLFSA